MNGTLTLEENVMVVIVIGAHVFGPFKDVTQAKNYLEQLGWKEAEPSDPSSKFRFWQPQEEVNQYHSVGIVQVEPVENLTDW